MKILFWIKKQFSKGTFPDVYIQSPSYIRSNVEIGRYTYIMSNSNIYSNVRIGRYCSIAPNVLIGATSHPVNWLSSHIFQIERPTYFKGGAILKQNGIFLQKRLRAQQLAMTYGLVQIA